MRFKFLINILCIALLASTAFATQSRVVAVVNGEMISSYDLEKRADSILRSMGVNPETTQDIETVQTVELQILDQMIEELVLLQEAANEGYAMSDEALDAELNSRIESMGMSREEFLAQAARSGLTEASLKEDIRRNILIQQLIATNISQKIIVREEEINEYYAAHPDINGTPTDFRIGLLIYPNQNTADRYFQEIESGVTTFVEAAQAVSIGPSPRTGGDMGMLPVEDLAPDLVSIVATMDVGESSSLLSLGPNPAQIHLFDRIVVGGGGPLDDLTRERIKQILREPQFTVDYEEYLARLMDRALIDIRY